MKKAIVMEKHRQYTIVLTQDGKFQKAKPVKNADVGAEVSYELFKGKEHILFLFHPSKVNKSFRLITMACLLLLFVMPFYFISGNNKTYAYVNVDINPSVELEIGEDLQVHSILPLNDDAKKIVEELADYKGEPLGAILSRIMDKSEEEGLIKNGKNVLVGVSYVNDKTHKISVLDTVDSYLHDHKTDWKTATFRVPKEIRDDAKEKEKSMNELMATSLVNQNPLDDNGVDSTKQNPMNDEERAIINSFYNNEKPKVEKVDKTTKSNNETASDKRQHPSERKGKNGTITNKNKETSNKGKSNVAKEKHKKAKMPKKDIKNKAKRKGIEKNKHKHNNGKNKDRHKHKHKHDKKDNHGKGNNKHNNKHKNAHSHK